ncbi:hypothetical protein BDN72DRAFT_959557 [Pluteus cervinus]|uniref:Uncharacterized protein n=1 Tax=Pluteus cervinus TaxID=181527 RepID=A0ACD3AWY0_9AGAR|nr:hypothetical protein BDN72DRAFT_959557 [Pluteus cervinus]
MAGANRKDMANPRTLPVVGHVHDLSSSILPSTDLPAELISVILEDYKPLDTWGADIDTRNMFRERTHTLAQFRLISKSWYHCITPIIYSTLLICTGDADIERRLQGVKYHPQLIRTVILLGQERNVEAGLRVLLPKYLTSCLTECPNLQRFEIVEPDDVFGIFSKGTMERILRSPNLPHPTSLTLRSLTPHTLETSFPYALRALGPMMAELRELEIHSGAHAFLNPPYFQFPRRLPFLESLSITGLGPPAFRKMLSSVGKHKRVRGHNPCISHPLRHLSICWRSAEMNKGLFDCILINDISSHLTSLHIYGLGVSYFGNDVDGPPSQLLRLCPRLNEFFYFCPSMTSYLDNLPPTLTTLGVYLTNSHHVVGQYLSSPSQLLPLITTSNLRRNIKKLLVGREAETFQPGGSVGALEVACHGVGLELELRYLGEP